MYQPPQQQLHPKETPKEFDEPQGFSLPFNTPLLIQSLLGQILAASAATLFAISNLQAERANTVNQLLFAAFAAAAVAFLATTIGTLRILLTKRPWLRIHPTGITRYHSIGGGMFYPWNEIGSFSFRSVTRRHYDTIKTYIFLDILAKHTPQNRLFTINTDAIETPGPDAVAKLEAFTAVHRQNHPERFAPQAPTALRLTQRYKNIALLGAFLLLVFIAAFLLFPLLHSRISI